jgi:hypothetical protein
LAQQEVVMVGQQAVDDDTEAQFVDEGLHFAEDEEVIVWLAEDGLAVCAAILEVVVMAGLVI